MAYMLIFLLNEMWVAFAFHIFFSAKNTCELDIELTRTLNILTINELVKLAMLWTTGPWALSPWAATWENVPSETCIQRRLKSACAFAPSDQSLPCPHEETLQLGYSKMRSVKILIRLRECADWSESSPGALVRRNGFWYIGSYVRKTHFRNTITEPAHDKTYNKNCAISEDSGQPAHPRNLISVFAVHMCLLQPQGYSKRDKREPLLY